VEVFDMRRAIGLASLLLLLLAVLGTAAYAGCQTCLEKIIAERSGTGVTLTIVARSADETFVFPDTGAAVVMQVDGNGTKCLNVHLLRKGTEGPGMAVYSGTFTAYGEKTHSGRVDVGGQIWEFTVPLDGKTGGTLAYAADQSPLEQARFQSRPIVSVTAAPAPSAPANAPAAADPAFAGLLELMREPAFLIGAMVVLITIVGAYVDRRRALARTLAG
jgi:hypothetical protein